MNKITLALTVGTGLTLGLAAPSAQAAVMTQALETASTSASQFSALFDTANPAAAVQTSSFEFAGAPGAGAIQSEVFKGKDGTAASGLYAYAYQVGVNQVTNGNGDPVQVNSASWRFNGTPVDTSSLGLASGSTGKVYAYTINDGPVGGLNLPNAAPGESIQAPTQLNWVTGNKTGSITAQFLDSKAPATGPLDGGAKSSTFVVITNQPFATTFANVNSPDPQVGGLTQVYAPTGGTADPVPVPEPTTVIAWAGVLGGIALVRRVRKNRAVVLA